MARKVFISYRREDSKAEARSIYQTLERAFGRDQVFMDVDNIRKGLDFRKVLLTALGETAVMLVVIGRRWVSISDDTGRRLDDPADFVRLEISNALIRDIPVIPICVDGSRLPLADELPAELRALTMRQGTVITHEKFSRDMEALLEDIRPLIDDPKRASRRPWAAIAAAVVSLSVLAGAGLWWTIGQKPEPRSASVAAHTSPSSPTPPPGGDVAVREAAAAVSGQHDEERQRRESEVRRRVEDEMNAEARRKVDAARAQVEVAARQQAEADARRRIERARLEAEAEALRKVHAEEEQRRMADRDKAAAAARQATEKARARRAEIEAAWQETQRLDTLESYLHYLNSYRDADNRGAARARALPLLRRSVEEQIDDRFSRGTRPDGQPSFYLVYPNNPRAGAACIDWNRSAPTKLWFVASALSGNPKVTPIEERVQQALGQCRSRRAVDASCTCEIVRRFQEKTTEIPQQWIARQLD